MQKRIKIVSISIVFVIILIGIIVINNNFNNKYSFTQDGIKYALTLDGEKTTSFPSKGMYKAQVTCEGADGRWLYDEWKLAIENISGDISCDIDFSTITNTGLNDYIISLAGTTQGTGEVVNETSNIPDYSSAVAISQSSYTSQNVFSSDSQYASSGTVVSGVYTFANNMWTSVSNAMTSDTYYHFKFNPSENGYYQLCYNLSAGNANNQVFAEVNTKWENFGASSFLSASTSENKNGCIELGYVTTSQYIKVVQRAYTDISTLSFSVKKIVKINSVIDTRYEGKNPNNYIWFNNEYWRIIGVFDSASHGQIDKKLVKIIRDESLGSIAFDKSNKNNWSIASLRSLLNETYYNAQDGTSSGYCYGYSTTVTSNCDYTKKGIKNEYRGMIVNAEWYLGGASNTNVTAETFYGYERGAIVEDKSSIKSTGYIGLVYLTDLAYSVLASDTSRDTRLNLYNSEKPNWLRLNKLLYTITPYNTSTNLVFYLRNYGDIDRYSAASGLSVYPVLYLDSSVFLYDGDGSLENPYIIGMKHMN